MATLEKATEIATDKTYVNYRNKMKSKFETLANGKTRYITHATATPTRYLKPVTLNLCEDQIPQSHK